MTCKISFCLVGHSMGGTVAYLVAQAQPGRIARLVVEDAPPPFPRERPVPARPAGELSFDWDVVPAIVEEVNDPSMRYWKHLPEITAPTLLVGGGSTSHIPQDLLVDVSRAVPDCSVVTIPVGHDVHESKPDLFAKTVLNWLEPTVGPASLVHPIADRPPKRPVCTPAQRDQSISHQH